MRTRVKNKFIPSDNDMIGSYVMGQGFNITHLEVQDVNNRSSRPQSPCDMVKTWTSPQKNLFLDGTRYYINYNASDISEDVRLLARQKMSDFTSYARSVILEKELGLSKRFSSINFFLELGDVSGMIKSLDKYRYVDYQFGISPMIGDIKNIHNALSTSIAAINSRLDAYAKPVPFRLARTYHTGASKLVSEWSYRNLGRTVNYDGNFKCAFNGTVKVELPLLSRYNRDYTIWLDQIGFHPDLATVYEAIPFSWMVDWFVPVGDYLESLSSSWLNPSIYFDGSFSCTYTASTTVRLLPVLFPREQDPVPKQLCSESTTTGYICTPLTKFSLTAKRPEIKLGLGLDSLGKTALLSDIFGPTKAPSDRSPSRDRFIKAYDKLSYPFQKGQKVRIKK